jgi:hypothetical protein
MKAATQAFVVTLAIVAALAPVPDWIVEQWFSVGLYPHVQRLLTPVANLLPFAWLDVLSIAAGVAVLVALVRAAVSARRVRRITPMLRTAVSLGVAAAAVYLVFLVLWGFNYRRVPMNARLAVEPGAPRTEAVVTLGIEAAEHLNALREDARRSGWSTPPVDDPELRRAFQNVQRLLSDAPSATPGRLKNTVFGTYFRWSGVDGMINPFGLEVLSNPDLLPFERPFIAAHEWAHLAGYADESEASFVGWLTCMHADVPAQYSGWLFLYWQINGELDADGRARLAAVLGDGPRADINAIVDRLVRGQRPWVRVAGWRLYDQYLKANRVEEGIRSYGAVVTLILQARFEPGWIPVRRGTGGPAPGS